MWALYQGLDVLVALFGHGRSFQQTFAVEMVEDHLKACVEAVDAVVVAKSGRRQVREVAAEEGETPCPESEVARSLAHPATNDDPKPAIVTIRRPGKRFADVLDMTPEEHQRRGEAADALFRELVRRAAGNDG